MEPYIGQIILFAGNFAPRGWLKCDGTLLEIGVHTALYSIFGTLYGGDGRRTFGVPDLRSRIPIGHGHGNGLTLHQLGARGGAETVTLSISQMPAHTHTVYGVKGSGDSTSPQGAFPAEDGEGELYASMTDTAMGATSEVGGVQAHGNVQPFLAMNYIVAFEGAYPMRN